MSTPSHQNSHSDMNRRTQDDDRRKQTDRRRDRGRREDDPQHPGQFSQTDRNNNAQPEEHTRINLSNHVVNSKSKKFSYVLSEDEIRFLLNFDQM